MKFGVVVFPGSNCDDDMIHVLGNVFGREVTKIWHKEFDLKNFTLEDCIVLPGGFSYGDYLRSGALARYSPIMQSVINFAKKGGKVLGICNGFQILCELGLLPGVLLRNESQRFICENIYLKTENRKTELTCQIPEGKILKIPIAHADGRYYAPSQIIDELENNGQVLFRYCGKNGEVSDLNNPNGSINNIAGICNKEGNVFGLMPHPERASENILGNSDGQFLFQSLLAQCV
jgi:phosphoribosylformylglycinamidine synthase subunit PurQ / glutaminase